MYYTDYQKALYTKNGVQCIFIVLVYDSMYFALIAYLLGCKTILRVFPNISYIVFSVSGCAPLAPAG